MSDPIPALIFERIKVWLSRKEPCQIHLHVNGDGCIVQADHVKKETVRAT